MPRRGSTRRAPKPTTTPSTNSRFPLHFELNLLINEALHKSFPPHLKGKLSYFQRIKGDMRKHVVDGDYICYSILRVCEILRSKDPIFRNTSSLDIAKVIIYSFESDMVQELKLVDVGFLSFKLKGDWIAERIRKNLKDGIAAWAPIFPAKRVIVDFPEQDIDAERHADGVRSTYIRDLLVRMLEYSGVEVCGKIRNKQSLQIVKKDFPEEEGFIRNKRTLESLFVRNEKATCKSQPNNVHEDLAALWCGEYVQKANWIIYVTPVRQREYILKCFDAARVFVKEDHTSMRYLGYQTSSNEKSNEKEKLAELWGTTEEKRLSLAFGDDFRGALSLCITFGYDPQTVFECIIRYEYLRCNTYSVCEIDDVKGYGFLNLLETRDIIRSGLKKFPHPNLESNKALVGKDRKMGLHLLQFTEIIEEAVSNLMPHSLCEYLSDFSHNFAFNFKYQDELSETEVLLFKAAEVVLEKGFDLLGITPESSNISHFIPQSKLLARDHYVAFPVLSPKLSSRFEIFSMTVEVLHYDIENGNLFGDIRVSDTYGVHPDKWCDTDLNGCGQVAYFDHNWYNPMVIGSTSLLPLPFGDPASRFSVPFSKSIKIFAHLWVSSKETNVVYQLCNVDGDEGEIRLEDFWGGEQKIERSTFHVDGENGCVSLYYYLIKEAVDTKISLECDLYGHPSVRGHIHAYYGGGALDSCRGYDKNFYKALIYDTGPANLMEGDLELKSTFYPELNKYTFYPELNKSTLAVPKNGVLVFDAFFEVVDSTEKSIMKETHTFSEECEGENSKWIIEGEKCRFILEVRWSRGRH